jgi:hypothetical protein
MAKKKQSGSRQGIYINPTVWRGPKTIVSEHLVKHGVDAKVFSIREDAMLSKILISKIIVVVTKDGS